jgi:hypothetical protein
MATPRFDGVELFLQIVESGNLTEAAERLNLTRSAVGKGLARLEARLGTCLLQRSTRTTSIACVRWPNSKPPNQYWRVAGSSRVDG